MPNLNLDRFAQGLKDPQEADFWTCPKCGKENYDMEAEYCPYCVEYDLIRFRQELILLTLKHGIDVEGKLIHASGREEAI